jgi:hypothetical protein
VVAEDMWEVVAEDMWYMVAKDMLWVAGSTINKTNPSSWGLAELGNK